MPASLGSPARSGRRPRRSERTQRQSSVVGFLKRRVTATRWELQSVFGISTATAVATLRAMREDGTPRREGRGRNARYRLS
ncbi:MAG: hypothetical protein SOY64_04770 [Pyramidobacter sp.]|uniref:hypothetical protein n=1 Tax=Pyramidobacter sp. TaxID=1943581 RepID=UPI002A81F85D|nr:hypothetical protein [Pyramidobacter sp.]MDY4032370.1 hypothetical protein [Pyramidobacter sp.]